MATVKELFGATTPLTVTSFNGGLASAGSAVSDVVDNTINLYQDVMIEVLVDDGFTPAGNTQVIIYAVDSVDETNYSTQEVANMAFVGSVACTGTPVAPGWRSRAFSLASAFGGFIPPKWKLVVYNDAGATLSSTGNAVQYRGLHMQSV